MALERYHQKEQGSVLSNKRVYPAIETGEFKGPGRMALKILTFEVIGEGNIGIPNPTYSNKQCEKWEEAKIPYSETGSSISG